MSHAPIQQKADEVKAIMEEALDKRFADLDEKKDRYVGHLCAYVGARVGSPLSSC